MPATTVKLDGELLRAIESVKSPKQTLSAYVREALQRDLRRRQMRDAAETYTKLLRTNAAEREAMDAWEAAPLATTPRTRRK
ncbi:MAG: YlcI/YnfO family protein [Chthoniobacterales bacterium]